MQHTIVFALYGKAAELAAYLVMAEVPFNVSFFEHLCYIDLTLTNDLLEFVSKAYPEGHHNA